MDSVLRLCVAAAALIVMVSVCGRAAEVRPGGVQMRDVTLAGDDAALTNPGMGLYASGTLDPSDLPPDAWFTRLIAIGYFRDDWAQLEPDADGQYKFDEYFQPVFDLWVKGWGKRVAFRFMSSNMHSRLKYVTPKWVFDSGVPFVVHRGLYTDEQVDPVFWDEKYLKIQEQFIADLGTYLDGRPGLEFVDIGSIGEWGEMHLSRWTADELRQTGFTEDKYIAAYRRIIDAFARAFPHTRVFLNVGDYDCINDYAAIRGLHFRQDGLTPSRPSADVGTRFYRPYSRRGVVCNYEFHSSYGDMREKGWGVRETFEKGLSDPISYLHLNLVDYEQLANPAPEVKEAIVDASRRIGFRFVLEELSVNDRLRLDGSKPGRLVLTQTWRNAGVAPCYDSYALRWSLVGRNGHAVAETVTFPRTPTTLWWPGETVPVHDMLLVPAATLPGAYRLKVEMMKPEQPGTKIMLAIAGRDAEGRYDLGGIRAERVERRPEPAYEEHFASGAAGWSAENGMSVAAGKDTDGRPCLVVTGRQPGAAWSYASTRVNALPYTRYRLSCWMRVEEIEPDRAPYVKLGVNAGDGAWLTNINSNPYDLRQLGRWQLLVADGETPPTAATADIAIERGVLETPISAAIRIRDIKLEVLETP
jgi:hypothetical protein